MNDRNTLLDLQGNNLVTIAVLKSVQLNQTINFLYNQVFAITTRVLVQSALVEYYAENQTLNQIFQQASVDFQTAIGTQQQILEGRIYTNNFTLLPDFTFSDAPYNFSDSLFPTSVPPTPHGASPTSTGQVLGPVPVAESPGLYVISMTIPIVNINSSSQPLILGYMSMIMSATGLLRAVNDSTGMGTTGQLLVIAHNGTHYDVILPPLRTPQIYEQDFYPGQYPAVDLAFRNLTGYLISTHNVAYQPVSVGYTVNPFQ